MPPPIRFPLNFCKTNYHLDLPFSVAVRCNIPRTHFDTGLVRIGCYGNEI